MKNIKKFEIFSALGTIVFGSILHFTFEWSGRMKIVALIAAVNESTWEHLKLAFWPAFIFAGLAYLLLKDKPKNFCLAQMVKLVSMPLLIVVLFYSWQAFFVDNFIYDISIFVVVVILGHIFSYLVGQQDKNYQLQKLSTIIIILLIILFSLLTYFPINNLIFLDPVSSGYGIVNK